MGGVVHHVEGEIEGLQQPQHHRHQKDQSTGFHQKSFYLLPHVGEHIPNGGQAVGGQLQHKGGGLPGEQGPFEEQPGGDAHQHPDDVQPEDHQSRPGTEKGGGDQSVDRQLGGAGHEGHQEDGHAPVLLVLHGPGAHDGGDRTAEAHEHGDEGLSAQPEPAQGPVHDKCRPGHIARVLQKGQKQEQQGDLGQEGEHTAHAGDDAVAGQGDEDVGHPQPLQSWGQPLGKSVHGRPHPVGQPGAEGAEGDHKHHQHGTQEQGDGEYPVGDHLVDLLAEGQFPGHAPPDHRGGHHPLYVLIPAVGNKGLPVA